MEKNRIKRRQTELGDKDEYQQIHVEFGRTRRLHTEMAWDIPWQKLGNLDDIDWSGSRESNQLESSRKSVHLSRAGPVFDRAR